MARRDEEFPAPEERLSAPEEYPQPGEETEFRLPDPRAEDSPPPGPEYETPPEEREFTPPRSLRESPAPAGKKRRLRKLLYAAAAAVLLLLLFRGNGELPEPPFPETILPGRPAGTPAAAPTPTPLPAEGGVPYLDISYAVLPAEEQDTVHYCYFSYPCMSDPSVEAYVSVSDGSGTVQSPDNPDVWEHSRDRQDYTIDVSALKGENMVLTVAVRYKDAAGEEQELSQSLPVTRLSPEPDLSAALEVYEAGGAVRIDYAAKFLPQEGDRHHYDLTVEEFWLGAYDVSGDHSVRYPFGESESATEFRLPDMSALDGGGYRFSYIGPYPGWHIPAFEEINRVTMETYNVILVLKDRSTGAYYTVETEKALLSELPALPEVTPEPTPDVESTQFQCQLVFFNFSAYHHGFVKLINQDKVTAGTVEIWEKNLDTLEWSHELTAEEIAQGYYEIPEFDDSDTFFRHMDYYEENNGMPEMELRLTLTVDGENGAETLSYSKAPSYEQGWSVGYWPDDYEPIWDWEECYPGCFAVKSYESLNREVRMRPGDYQEAEMTGEICVELKINGVPVPTEGVTVLTSEEPVYALNDDGDYVPTGKTYYYASIVFPRPEDAPSSGTAEFTVYQKLEAYDLVWVTHREIEY